jgi:DNA helicase-2/ATP-dependent DNA helicase PcrA
MVAFSISKGLTDAQKRAIEKTKGACVILAGAGTGKTYTIVEKVKHIIGEKIYPAEKVVCITFSNEAANSLLSRVQKVLGNGEKEPIVRTFHAFSGDLLREHGAKIGLKQDFAIIEPDDAKVILHRNLKVQAFYCHKYIQSIGTAKDLGITLEQMQKHVQLLVNSFGLIDLDAQLEKLQFELQTLHLRKDDDRKKMLMNEIRKVNNVIQMKKFVNAWSAYEKIKIKQNCLDYSDLNKYSLQLLSEHPEIADDYDYVVVDEFQDTNKIQLDFLRLLAVKKNITVVGDLNQSIYRFRGAYKDNFELFKKHFSVTAGEIFNLDKSRRSTNTILRVAHKLILNNYTDKEECFFVENYNGFEGDKIECFELKNAKEEARKVVEIIKSQVEKGVPLEEICVMFRNHQYGRVVRRALDLENIPYVSVSKESLLKNKSVKNVISYLDVLDKMHHKRKGGESAWWNLFNSVHFPEEDLIKIGKFMKPKNRKVGDNGNGYENEIEEEKRTFSERLIEQFEGDNGLGLSQNALTLGRILISRLRELLEFADKEIEKVVLEVYRVSGYSNERDGVTREQKETIMNLDKFHEVAKSHSTIYGSELSSFISYLEIVDSLGIEIESVGIEDVGVRLMTSHATKGLEYRTVIVTNLANKRFPMDRINTNPLIPLELSPQFAELKHLSKDDLEEYNKEFERAHQLMEERRLCYVAFTRAKEKLFLTYANEYAEKKSYASQFLNEVDYRTNADIVFAKDLDEKFVEKEEMKKEEGFVSADNIEKVDRTKIALSPSALRLFDECEKQFEYKYVYNMPEKKPVSWEAIQLGSFVHLVLEEGVKKNWRSLKEFVDYARELHLEEEWEEVNLDEVEHLLKVFYARNKDKYNQDSKTEISLWANIDGINFTGFADRIDFSSDGMEIIDYKTGKSAISPKDRNWQLGYYAIAAMSKYGRPVKRITLETLKQDAPQEFDVLDNGDAISVNSNVQFNINDVKAEILDVARRIHDAYSSGFKPCPVDKNCDFCGEYVYGK